MIDIKWEDGAVCFLDKEQHLPDVTDSGGLLAIRTRYWTSLNSALTYQDFQLNEMRQGDYIPISELDTEQKYNDAIEVLGLFGYERFKSYESSPSYHSLYLCENKVLSCPEHYSGKERGLTYNQLIAIGKLKRSINKRKSAPASKVNRDIERVVGGAINDDRPKLATQYLNECIQVQKQRGEQYDSTGTGERSFDAAAKAFNAITGQNLKGSDVCLLLTCVKGVRQYSNPNRLHEDSLLDGVSYMSLWAEELNKELK